jgi:hypothetical protein
MFTAITGLVLMLILVALLGWQVYLVNRYENISAKHWKILGIAQSFMVVAYLVQAVISDNSIWLITVLLVSINAFFMLAIALPQARRQEQKIND